MALKKASATDELEKTLDTIDEEEMRHLNVNTPVADEDGYIRGEKLLAGYIDKDGVLHDTFDYREMTGKDEEAISKAEVKSNGAKLCNVLVERCVERIGTIDKKEVGADQYEYITQFTTNQKVTYNDGSKDSQQKFRIHARVNAEFRIVEFNMSKIME